MYGQDWAVLSVSGLNYSGINEPVSIILQGISEGITQTATRGSLDNNFVWNFPLDITFKSTNPFGCNLGVSLTLYIFMYRATDSY